MAETDFFQAINPRSGAAAGVKFAKTSSKEVEEMLRAAHLVWQDWTNSELDARIRFCRKAAQQLRSNARALAENATVEMGKLLPESLAEVEKCALLCDFYAAELPTMVSLRKVAMQGANAYVKHESIGLILGIMPWNFPYWQVVRFAVPAIAAGNVAILKHAPNVPACAQALTDCLKSCADKVLLYNIRVDNEATEALIGNPMICGVSLTGSTSAGRAVGAAAGRALKPSVLELGGSDPYIVLEDANLDQAIEACFQGRILNAGQSCISAKRILVVSSLYEQFVVRLKAKITKLKFAPLDYLQDGDQHLAPLARADLRLKLHAQVEESMAQGARCEEGGHFPTHAGFYYPATLLLGVKPGMAAFEEEVFGPVFCLSSVESEQQAIEWANASKFALGAAVFSRDLERAERVALKLRSGSSYVNTFVQSNPKLPFGGVGESGYGRELAKEGLHAFTNVRTVFVQHPQP